MNLKDRIFEERNHKSHWKKLSEEIIREQKILELLSLFFSEDKRISQRASSFFMTIIDIDSRFMNPYLDEFLQCLSKSPTTAQKRNIVRFLQFVDIPEKDLGKVYTLCTEYLSDLSEAIAVRAFAMKVAFNISEKYSELKPELADLIRFNLDQNPSSGIKNRGQKLLKLLLKD